MTVDFHAHIQPEADHGCLNADMALRQLRLAQDAGIDALVSVSHYYPNSDDAQAYLKLKEDAKARLMEKIKGETGLPKIIFGTEVTLCPGLHKLKELRELCIEGTDCILIELPKTTIDLETLETLDGICEEVGLTPVIAHIDRYTPKCAEVLLEHGYLCQLNISAFGRLFGNKQLLRWIDSGYAIALGSDLHQDDVGYKLWSKARKFMGEDRFEHMMAESTRILGL